MAMKSAVPQVFQTQPTMPPGWKFSNERLGLKCGPQMDANGYFGRDHDDMYPNGFVNNNSNNDNNNNIKSLLL